MFNHLPFQIFAWAASVLFAIEALQVKIISIPLSVIAVMLIAPFYPKLLEHHTKKVYIIRIAAAAVLVYAGIRLS